MPRERKPRIGLLRSYFPGPESLGEAHIVQEVMEEALRKLTEIATFVDVAEDGLPIWFDVPTLLSEVDVQEFEMRTAVDKFFSSKHVLETPHRTLASVAASGDYDQRALTDVFWNTLKPGIDTTNPAYQGRLKRMTLLHEVLRQRFREQNLDAIAFPHQRRLVMEIGTRNQLDRNGILASLTGCPSLCIPCTDISFINYKSIWLISIVQQLGSVHRQKKHP
jgi:amidase